MLDVLCAGEYEDVKFDEIAAARSKSNTAQCVVDLANAESRFFGDALIRVEIL